MKNIVAPNSRESEMMVLGCMLVSEDSLDIVVSALTPEDFYYMEHRIIFTVINSLQIADKPVDVHIISEELKKIDQLDTAGGVAYLTSLAQYAGTSAYVEEYISIVKEKSILRKLVETGRSLEKMAFSEPENLVDQIELFQKGLDGLKRNKIRAEWLYGYLLSSISEKAICEEIRSVNSNISVGMSLGKIDLKLQGGAMTIVAGPTGHGKTIVKINMILNYLRTCPEKSVYFFSYEESRASIFSLFLNTYINSDLSRNNRESIKSYFREGKLTYFSKDKQEIFLRKKEEFFSQYIQTGRLNIFYCDYSIEEFVEAIRFIKTRTSVALIAVDYMQLLHLRSKKKQQRQEELKEICLILKNLAIETGIPFLIGAQFNRTVVNESAMSPLAIGEAGDIERAAHTVIGLWNRNFNDFTDEGKKSKDGKRKQKESAIYMEILKGRETGIGHSSVFDFNGNTGVLHSRSSSNASSHFG